MGALPVFVYAATKERRGWTRPDANGDRYPAEGGIASGINCGHRPISRLSDIAPVHQCREAYRGR